MNAKFWGQSDRPRLVRKLSCSLFCVAAALAIATVSSLASVLTLPIRDSLPAMCWAAGGAVVANQLLLLSWKRRHRLPSVQSATSNARASLWASGFASVLGVALLFHAEPASRVVWLFLAFLIQFRVANSLRNVCLRYLKNSDWQFNQPLLFAAIGLGTCFGGIVSFSLASVVSPMCVPIAMIPGAFLGIQQLKSVEMNFAPLHPTRMPELNSITIEARHHQESPAIVKFVASVALLLWFTLVVSLDVLAMDVYANAGWDEAKLIRWFAGLSFLFGTAATMTASASPKRGSATVRDAACMSIGYLAVACWRSCWSAAAAHSMPFLSHGLLRAHSFFSAGSLIYSVEFSANHQTKTWLQECVALVVTGVMCTTMEFHHSAAGIAWLGLACGVITMTLLLLDSCRGHGSEGEASPNRDFRT